MPACLKLAGGIAQEAGGAGGLLLGGGVVLQPVAALAGEGDHGVDRDQGTLGSVAYIVYLQSYLLHYTLIKNDHDYDSDC